MFVTHRKFARGAPRAMVGSLLRSLRQCLTSRPVEIEFDPNKDARNVRVRGLSLSLGSAVLMNLIGEIEDTRTDYGERRMIAYGIVAGELLCTVYTRRGDAVRVISLRRAKAREIRRWL